MKHLVACVFAACITAVALAHAQGGAPNLSAAEIIEKSAAARGGVEAWRKMQTMAWAGHTESTNSPGRRLPFMLEQKRPDKTRFEVMVDGQKSVRMYDGTRGWKVRPNGNGRPETQPYSEGELRFARGASVIEGPLMDYVARGGAITVGGIGAVEGRKAYILDVKLPTGGNHRVWVDAETFLELRLDRDVRDVSHQPAMTTVFYRDYRAFEGLQIPLTIETGSVVGQATNKLVIERVALNPAFDDARFAPPSEPVLRRRGVVVDTRTAASGVQPKVAP